MGSLPAHDEVISTDTTAAVKTAFENFVISPPLMKNCNKNGYYSHVEDPSGTCRLILDSTDV
jgi:hypothetical protein